MAELPHLGKHCNAELCNQLDFLPVSCDACSRTFCVKHFPYQSHDCSESYMKNVQVPVCPLCSKPVPTPKGISADVQVNEHILNNCTENRKQKVFSNRCTVQGCKKKELVPLLCRSCNLNFCISHRHESDHKCAGSTNGKGLSKAGLAAAARARNAQSCSSQARDPPSGQSDDQRDGLSQEERDRRLALQMQRDEYERGNQPAARASRSQGSTEKCTVS